MSAPICSSLVLLALAACTGTMPPDAATEDGTAASPLVTAGRAARAYDSAGLAHLLHGVAGDESLVFATEALDGRVVATDRFTGEEIGALPPPPGGFLLPFALRVPRTGHLVVLDAGGFPSPVAQAIPRVYDYDYRWDAKQGRFAATLSRSVSFAGLPLLFAEDVEVLPDGRYVVSESVLGALWIVHADGTIGFGVFPAGFAPDQAVAGLNPCLLPDALEVGGIPFGAPGNFAPGVGSLANRDGWLYFGNSCLGGIRRIPVASLEDPARAPFQRGLDIELVSAPLAGRPHEVLKGLTFNRWSADDHLFATDPLNLRVLDIDIHTGAREVLASDPVLFNFPVSAQYLPPARGHTPVVVASDQEHRLAAFNQAIPADLLQPPFLVTTVYVGR